MFLNHTLPLFVVDNSSGGGSVSAVGDDGALAMANQVPPDDIGVPNEVVQQDNLSPIRPDQFPGSVSAVGDDGALAMANQDVSPIRPDRSPIPPSLQTHETIVFNQTKSANAEKFKTLQEALKYL